MDVCKVSAMGHNGGKMRQCQEDGGVDDHEQTSGDTRCMVGAGRRSKKPDCMHGRMTDKDGVGRWADVNEGDVEYECGMWETGEGVGPTQPINMYTHFRASS